MKDLLKDDKVYELVSQALSSIDTTCVDVKYSKVKGIYHVNVVIYKSDGVGLDECSAASNLIAVLLENHFNDRDLRLEVSSPGLSREFKDIIELQIFKGKRVSFYYEEDAKTYSGILEKSDKNYLFLENDDNKYNIDSIKKLKLIEESL